MSNSELPLSVDALKPFEQGSERTGRMPVAGFSRLRPLLVDDEGLVEVGLTFSFDEDKRRIIDGWLKATLNIECQRCLEPMAFTLDSDFRVGVVDSEALAEQLPTDLEPVVVTGREIDVSGLIEDELIMSLPDFPLHERDECGASETLDRVNSSADDAIEQARKGKENPFQVLAGLGKADSGDQEPDQ